MEANDLDNTDIFERWVQQRRADDELFPLIPPPPPALQEGQIVLPYLTKKGTVRKVRRSNYSRSAKRRKPPDLWLCNTFLQLYLNPHARDPTHARGKEFRRWFRVPFPIFEEILTLCRATNDKTFCYDHYDICGEPTIPLELKVMIVLRILAGGLLFVDGMLVASCGMSETSINTFFKDFLRIFRQHYESTFIKPLTGAAFHTSAAMYTRMGLPGAVGNRVIN
jgi:hypothetical protein